MYDKCMIMMYIVYIIIYIYIHIIDHQGISCANHLNYDCFSETAEIAVARRPWIRLLRVNLWHIHGTFA